MVKTRVHSLAMELALDVKDIIAHLDNLGIKGKKSQSSLENEEVIRIKAALDYLAKPRVVVGEERVVADRMVTTEELQTHEKIFERRVRTNVIRRRTSRTEVLARPHSPEEVSPIIDLVEEAAAEAILEPLIEVEPEPVPPTETPEPPMEAEPAAPSPVEEAEPPTVVGPALYEEPLPMEPEPLPVEAAELFPEPIPEPVESIPQPFRGAKPAQPPIRKFIEPARLLQPQQLARPSTSLPRAPVTMEQTSSPKAEKTPAEQQVTRTKSILRKGFVEELRDNGVFVSTDGDFGVVHSFWVSSNSVPGRALQYLETGEEVLLQLSLRKSGIATVDRILLTEEEIQSLPDGWKYDSKKCELSVPICLDDKAFKDRLIRSAVIDRVQRQSWLYAFVARIAYLNERVCDYDFGDFVSGEIGRVYRNGPEIKSAEIILENGAVGFVFRRHVDLPDDDIIEGTTIELYVVENDPNSGRFRLGDEDELDAVIRRKESELRIVERSLEDVKAARGRVERELANLARLNELKNKLEEYEAQVRNLEKQRSNLKDLLNRVL